MKNTFKYISKNGHVISSLSAHVSLYNIEYTYGFGVYENVRVVAKHPRFVREHTERLLASAHHIGLEHTLTSKVVADAINNLISALDQDTYNLKILLIGGRTAKDAELYILPLQPKFPDRNLYKKGARVITIEYERYLPQAKSLNMLPSYLAYRDAQAKGAYDALLINSRGEITEGTRTNFFMMKEGDLLTPPTQDVLEGVTRQNVFRVAELNGISVREQPMRLKDLDHEASYFLTSTSSKIMPLKQINNTDISISDELRDFMARFDEYIREVSS